MQRFRGFHDAELLLGEHAVVVGQPRAGRTDVVTALRRVLDPSSTSGRVDALDVHSPAGVLAGGWQLLTEVEVTLVNLGVGLEQDFFAQVEVLDPGSFLPAGPGASAPVTGLRLCYRLEYDEATGVGTHWVDFPGRSDPATARWSQATRAQRSLPEALEAGTRLLYVVLTRARVRTVVLIFGTLGQGLVAPLAGLRGSPAIR